MASKSFTHVVQVTVFKARDLKDADLGGKSDAYAIVKVKGAERREPDEFRTEVVADSVDPEWNAVSLFLVEKDDDEELRAQIKLYDEDRGGDDSLGEVTISLDPNGLGVEGWVDIEDGKGQLYLRAAAVPAPEVSGLKSMALGLQNEIQRMKEEDEHEKKQLAELTAQIAALEADDAADEEAKANLRTQLQRAQALTEARTAAKWVHCESSKQVESLSDTVNGGHEPNGMQQFVGRKGHDGCTIPSKILPAADISLFGYQGKEHVVSAGVEVLVVPEESVEWAPFPLDEEQQERLVIAGRQSNGSKIFAARGPVGESVQIGHLFEKRQQAQYPHGGTEKNFDSFDVLLHKLA